MENDRTGFARILRVFDCEFLGFVYDSEKLGSQTIPVFLAVSCCVFFAAGSWSPGGGGGVILFGPSQKKYSDGKKLIALNLGSSKILCEPTRCPGNDPWGVVKG